MISTWITFSVSSSKLTPILNLLVQADVLKIYEIHPFLHYDLNFEKSSDTRRKLFWCTTLRIKRLAYVCMDFMHQWSLRLSWILKRLRTCDSKQAIENLYPELKPSMLWNTIISDFMSKSELQLFKQKVTTCIAALWYLDKYHDGMLVVDFSIFIFLKFSEFIFYVNILNLINSLKHSTKVSYFFFDISLLNPFHTPEIFKSFS